MIYFIFDKMYENVMIFYIKFFLMGYLGRFFLFKSVVQNRPKK